MGPYEIIEVFENGSVKLTTIDQEGRTFLVNGHRLKIYHKPVRKEYFVNIVTQENEVQIVHQSAVISMP